MRSIPLLAVDAKEVLESISAAKQAPRDAILLTAQETILSSYGRYEEAVPEVGELEKAALTELQKEAVQHGYTSETLPMVSLRTALLDRECVVRCPFCGIGESTTLDHYLPKEKYPEFSVFPKNLVPSCGYCNTRKSDRILLRGSTVRMFLHPCFDVIPEDIFVVVKARMKGGALALSYTVRRPNGMKLARFQHLQSHFKEMNLADRYRRMGLENLGEKYPSLRRAYGNDKDPQRVAKALLEAAGDVAESKGENYWLVRLYRALAEVEVFCDGGFEIIKPSLAN
ncbi:hypothetical protein [Stenotrophomonas lactitubi]|uniref:HNH endonuclease n=1 Tax=Stenotrophomonas lactitubi TaxID=2045214 RepID=UPI003208C0EA